MRRVVCAIILTSPLPYPTQVQGRAWSQLVQGKRCGWLVDQDTPFEDSPAALCSSHAVQLALERPPWSPQLNSMWPQRFKARCVAWGIPRCMRCLCMP